MLDLEIMQCIPEKKRNEITKLHKVIEAMENYEKIEDRKVDFSQSVNVYKEILKDLIYDQVVNWENAA